MFSLLIGKGLILKDFILGSLSTDKLYGSGIK
jgi:hypothetical protein